MPGALRFAAILALFALATAAEEPAKKDAKDPYEAPPIRLEQSCLLGENAMGVDTPTALKTAMAPSKEAKELVEKSRDGIRAILRGNDQRLVVIVGPCSLHDIDATKEYAGRLAKVAKRLEKELLIVMRAHFEKPRTQVGWKGLINDPKLDGTKMLDVGLPLSRRLLKDIVEMGVPCSTEFLCPLTAHYIADLISYGTIGARTCESQIHRELASYLPMPIGFKNSRSGNVQNAIDACIHASQQHVFLSLTQNGGLAAVESKGNTDAHIILRGGSSGPNYSKEGVEDAIKLQAASGASKPCVVVDCAHGNSDKKIDKQIAAAEDLIKQISEGDMRIKGVMLESFIEEGALGSKHRTEIKFGQSVTDECIGWDATEKLLESLAEAVRARPATILRKAQEAEKNLQEELKQRAKMRREQINRRA